MLKILQILVMAHALVGGAAMLSACGQKGPLVLPSTPDSAGRATLPETLSPWRGRFAPKANTNAPVPTPPVAPSATSTSSP
ncbi:lipoprotein [Limnohabitans sp. DCL3]|uniref:LPS translocon maturation chaperone LptM n=1 Tax=Limnohabitans sp. DCL3 TaxID=3374103 RepID=UPI003A8936D4